MGMYDYVNEKLGCASVLFNFATGKYVLIKDWRLGLLLRVLQLIILAYAAYDIVIKASYLEHEVPNAVISTSTQQSKSELINVYKTNAQSYEDEVFNYCSNPELYEIKKGNITHNKIKCTFIDFSSVTTYGDEKLFMTTYANMEKHYMIVRESEDDCPKAGTEGLPEDARKIFYLFNTCFYISFHNYFVVNPEDGMIEIYHSYYTSLIDKSGSLPRTIIKSVDYSDNEIEINEGEKIRFTIKELLDLIGVDLDKRLNEQDNNPSNDESIAGLDGNNTEIYPFARISGLNLEMKFQYYQQSLAPEKYRKSSGSNSKSVLCIIEVIPQYIWTQLPVSTIFMINDANGPFSLQPNIDVAEYNNSQLAGMDIKIVNHGINLSFQISGNLGEFSFNAVINEIVSVSVLLSLAQILTTFFALYGLGISSQLYIEFVKESVDWRQEYARYAAQALVAGYAFMGYDDNQSWKLDRREIYNTLNKLLNTSLSKQQIACLTDFLMRQGESDVRVSKGEFNLSKGDLPVSSLISVEEWVDIFTEEKVQLSSLIRLIDTEYKDEDTKDFLLRLSEGVKLSGITQIEDDIAPKSNPNNEEMSNDSQKITNSNSNNNEYCQVHNEDPDKNI